MKTIQRFLTVGLFMAIVLWGFLEPAMAERNPKIHVLFVWGTKATDTQKVVYESRRLFEHYMAAIGIREDGRYIASFTSLSGDDAHPAKILEHCKKMAQEAGPDDALFVYILCHSCIVLDGADKIPENYLSPIAANAYHMEWRTIGIKRSSIIKAMKSGNHRLNVLITESSPKCINFQIPTPICRISEYNIFLYTLLNAQGTINWGSSNPFGGGNHQGEISIAANNGTLFTHVFCRQLCHDIRRSGLRGSESAEYFFNSLGSCLTDEYKTIQDRERYNDYFEYLTYQDQQTLTEFDDDGRVKRTWSEKENRVDYH